MGKNKLKKFAEMEHIPFVFQFPFSVLAQRGFDLCGHWHDKFFGNNNPIVVELGCGKGEYTVGLARRNPDKNYIGIDIKGARMHSGATQAQAEGLTNVAFIRTSIELLDRFFTPGEVSEIWITFPDPQMKKIRKRLTATNFMQLYRKVLTPGGRIHLKTDSPFLYAYTRRMVLANPQAIKVVEDTADLYDPATVTDTPLDIRTHYENQWLQRGLKIKYLSFNLLPDFDITEVDDEDIPRDTYRSYSRGELEEEHLR